MQVWLGADALFIYDVATSKTIEPHLRRIWMRGVFRKQVRIAKPTGGRRLKAALAPAAVEIEAIDMSFVDER